MKKNLLLIVFSVCITFGLKAQDSTASVSVYGSNPLTSVRGFLNKIQFTGGSHGALVFHPGLSDELMFGFHANGSYYWGTGRNATNPHYYSMVLNGNTGDLNVDGVLTTKALSLNGSNETPTVNGFLNKIEFTGGSHGALVFHPNLKDELMFGLHTDGNFYWGTGKNATKPNYYAMFLEANTGDLGIRGKLTSIGVTVKAGGWADFVFEKAYKLPTLSEVEKHIKEKGHLMNIPSTNEVMEKGIELGEMDAKLLQKIEELTLYAIDQDKKIKMMDQENQELKSLIEKLAELQSRLEKLETNK